jgi:hypothetical protein
MGTRKTLLADSFVSCLAYTCFIMLFTFLSHCSTLQKKMTRSSEISFDVQRTAQHYSLEDRTLHNHHLENLKSYRAMLR